jgi:hypothetical protein
MATKLQGVPAVPPHRTSSPPRRSHRAAQPLSTRTTASRDCDRIESLFRFRVRLLHKAANSSPRAMQTTPALIREGSEDPRSGCCHPQGVSVELQKVVSGGDQAPFRANGRPASSFEAPDPSVRLDLGEDRLDHALSS